MGHQKSMEPRLKRLVIRHTSLVQGQGPTPSWTTGEAGDVEHSAVTRHSQRPRPMQTGVCWEPKTVLLRPGENVTWGLETGKSLPTLLQNTAGLLCICYCIFDTACRVSVVAQLKGSMTLCWMWPCVTPHPQCLGGHQRTGIKSPWRRPSSRRGEVRLCEEPKRTMLGNPPRCPGGFLEICEKDFKLRN